MAASIHQNDKWAQPWTWQFQFQESILQKILEHVHRDGFERVLHFGIICNSKKSELIKEAVKQNYSPYHQRNTMRPLKRMG